MKGYKAYNKGLTCRGFQFEVGKEYEEKEIPSVCNNGFHFCTNPLDVLNYYDLTDCEFTEVEAVGEIDDSNEEDSKVSTNKIKIGAKLDLPSFIKTSFDFLWENRDKKDTTNGNDSKLAASGYGSKLAASGDGSQLAASGDGSQLAASGNYSQLAASGYGSKLAASGDGSQLAASGDGSQLAASGNYSQLAASGYGSKLAASGNYSQLAASGDGSQLAASGYGSKLAASGNGSQLAASGYGSKLEITGNNSVSANIGVNGAIKGIIGTWITLAEYKDGVCVCVKSAKIDGKKLKENVWYKLINGKFVGYDN